MVKTTVSRWYGVGMTIVWVENYLLQLVRVGCFNHIIILSLRSVLFWYRSRTGVWGPENWNLSLNSSFTIVFQVMKKKKRLLGCKAGLLENKIILILNLRGWKFACLLLPTFEVNIWNDKKNEFGELWD